MSIAFKEGLKIPPQAMEQIIIGANQDVRQVGQWLTKAHVEKLKFYQLLRRTRGLRGLPYWSRFKCTTGLPPVVCRYQLPVDECQASNVRNSMHTDFLERRSSSPFFKLPFDINTTPLPKLNTKIKVMSNKKKLSCLYWFSRFFTTCPCGQRRKKAWAMIKQRQTLPMRKKTSK